ncbi:hypothetical protein CSA56_11480 [candidate division KSB3 bacterium]|uniref:Uncharacterized protein n=1 Tax=candidate division KSB3 bacterium TaxID=2044937 RepID=A0A2G6KFF8_9BACT|nr:MAG: hypothetical protein CSA56_11480 [candidate division KSB3 bacterium]
MWIVKLITFIEYHPYLFFCVLLLIAAVIGFFWKEHTRPSYRQQKDLEQLLKGFERSEHVGMDPMEHDE